ncbi:MAG: FAD:protein FMN transferase, partial [Planctomycetaceae bacterium]
AFNPAIEVISRRWRQASVDGVEPSAAELQQLVSMASQRHWQCQVEQGRLVRRSEQPLTLNAIAKGSIIDSVVLCLQSEFPQIDGLVVNIGGDLRAAGANDCMVTIPVPARDALNAAPLAVLQLSDRAIAT